MAPELQRLVACREQQRTADADLRAAARACVDAGISLRTAAEAVGVSPQTISNWANG